VAVGSATIIYTVNGSGSCSGSDLATLSVTVTPGPEAGTLSGTASVCVGNTTTITSNGDTGGTWTSSNNSIATVSASGAVTGVAVGSATITYTVNGSGSCLGSDLATLSVTVTPGPEAGILSGTASVCVGNTTTITSNGDTGGTWTSSNTSIATVNASGVVTGVAVGSATITYAVNGSGSCSGSDLATLSVTVTPGPEAGTLSGTASVCVGNTTTITSNGDAGGAWTSSNNSIATVSASGVVTGVAIGSATITYTVNGSVSCPGSDLATFLVTVNQAAAVSFTANQTNGCVPLTVTLTSSSNSGSCVWDIGNGQTLSGCTATYTFTQPGCYDISLISSNNGCASTVTENDVVCVESNPIASFSSSVTIFDELIEGVNFSNSSTGATAYMWNFGDGQSSTDINPFHTFTEATNGAYVELIAYSQSGCADTAQLAIGFQEGEVFYVPNCFTPDGDEYNNVFTPIFYSGYDPYNFELLIFNRWGELIFESKDVKTGWDGSYGLKGRKAHDGTYIWKISFKNAINDKRRVVIGHVNLLR
jgi:gliding motility-associated-like protein